MVENNGKLGWGFRIVTTRREKRRAHGEKAM